MGSSKVTFYPEVNYETNEDDESSHSHPYYKIERHNVAVENPTLNDKFKSVKVKE